jgi:Domain of unknown function (DUF4439)
MPEVVGLQSALGAEQAIVYGYGVVGAHLAGKEQSYAADRLTAHEVRRDQIATLITGLGVTPAASLPAYQLPFPVTDAASAKRLAAHLEDGAAGAAWDLAASTTARSAARTLAVTWLADAALSEAHWGGTATALPGDPSAPATS